MRAIRCDACEKPQPLDWQPGQLCIHCGGAVRVETRCAACTKWTVAGRFCRHCAAELVPDEWYGPARMLHAAGVDGLSLAERVRALHPEQREAFSSRFAVQRALVGVRVDEAKWCESFLVTTGHADRLEESLVTSLPLSEGSLAQLKGAPKGPFEGGIPELEVVHEHALYFETRALAALALLRLGELSEALVYEACSHLHVEQPLADEAVLVLARVRFQGRLPQRTRYNEELATQWLAAARATFKRRARPDAALGLAVALEFSSYRDEFDAALEQERVVDVLQAGLSERDEVVRAGCAWFLRDVPTLESLLESANEVLAHHARQRLSTLGDASLGRRLVTTESESERLSLLRALPTPLSSGDFTAVVAVLDRLPSSGREQALRKLKDQPWPEVDASARAQLEQWLSRATLSGEAAMELLSWAIETGDAERPYRPAHHVQPYVDAAVRALRELDDEKRSDVLWRIDPLLAAGAQLNVVELLTQWLRRDPTRLVERLFHFGHRFDAPAAQADDRATALFFAVWNALGADGRADLAPLLAEQTRRSRGSNAVTRLIPRFVEELFDRANERATVWLASKGLRDELEPRVVADARFAELDGGALAKRFDVLASWDEVSAPEVLHRLIKQREGDDTALVALTPSVFEHAERLLRAGEWRHGLWLAASFMSEAVNRFRTDERREAWRATVLTFARSVQHLQTVRGQCSPKDAADDLTGFLEQMSTELKLTREVLEREQADRAREQERKDREAARLAEQQRREAERAEQAAAQVREARAALDHARTTLEASTPAEGQALDTEVLLPEHPLKTLRDYAAFMRAMQRGADVMALFAQFEMTPQTWSACATAWGSLMTKRLEVAMRFGALLQAP